MIQSIIATNEACATSKEFAQAFLRYDLSELPPIPDGPAAMYAGKVKTVGKITHSKDRFGQTTDYILSFPYNVEVLKRVKMFQGRRWIAATKSWSVPSNQRNDFQMRALCGQKVYQRYDQKWLDMVEVMAQQVRLWPNARPLYRHQMEMATFELAMRSSIIAADMGLGKSLVNLQVIEMALALAEEGPINAQNTWVVSTKSGLASMQGDFYKWKANGTPRWMTYEAMTSMMKNWVSGNPAPQCIIFDEASKLKTPTSQRAQAAQALANAVRKEWGPKGLIVEQTGTPAPKSPVDWWNLCEVAQPGFLVEGTINELQSSIGITQLCEAPTGQKFNKILGWKDDRCLCNTCARPKDDPIHSPFMFDHHMYEPCTNEVLRLNKRMNGLLLVKMKKDCLDLPEKRYEVINLVPSPETLRAAEMVVKIAPTAAQAMILLREISDGFKYRKEDTGEATNCPCCKGTGVETLYFEKRNDDQDIAQQPDGPLEEHDEQYSASPRELFDRAEIATLEAQGRLATEEVECAKCGGEKTIRQTERHTDNFASPKDGALIDLLGRHEEVGRFVVFGGFRGTIDKCETIIQKEGWHTIRIDGSKVRFCSPDGTQINLPPVGGLKGLARMVHEFQDKDSTFEKICVIAHPQSGGTGLTLTRSPSILYYSNSFSGEDRTQSEDRIYRIGMDVNRGATIFDLIHLPIDELVLKNLKKKRRLELITLNDLQSAIELGDRYDVN